MAKITCIGILVADLVGRPIDHFPEKGQLMIIPQMGLYVGGGAHNTGVVLRRLGEEVVVVGKVGKDGLGEFVVNTLKKRGIDTRGIVSTEDYPTSSTMVMVDGKGERSFIHCTGANRSLQERDILDEFFLDSQLVHISGTFLLPSFDGPDTAHFFQRVKEKGIITSLDTYWDESGKWLQTIEPSLPYIDIFISNRDESTRISGQRHLVENAQFFLDYGIKVVAIKMGDEGSFIMTNKEKIFVPPYRVEVVDGTGAGDAFAAGFLVGYLKNWDLDRTGRFGNACGAMCVQKMGSTEGVGDFEEVMEFMKTHS
ncbi:MAG: carbohydrate kinase family protein [Candidatus Atribacteria bacterium]|nr:carbohydrate kinase family protein [Candidatus Atribacteria bacterium]